MQSKNFFATAAFKCTCGHTAVFYSFKQYADIVKADCSICEVKNTVLFSEIIVYYWSEEEQYFFPVVTEIAPAHAGCKAHHGKNQLYWTELIIGHGECDGMMQFVEQAEGKETKRFEKFAIEESKPKAPEMWYHTNDSTYMCLSKFDFKAN